MEKYHKNSFEKIPQAKRDRILNVATSEFAKKGFLTANINVIAGKAEISIGSMYNYFDSKENLLLSVIERGYGILEQAIMDVAMEQGNVFDKIEKLLRAAQEYSRKYPELHQVYLDITSEGLAHLSRKLSQKLETISSRFYKSLLSQAKKEGSVSPDLDEKMASFCIDNLILMLQFSYSSEYYRERMKIFLGEDACDDDERVIEGMMRFVRGALGCPSIR